MEVKVDETVARLAPQLEDICLKIHSNPELLFKEFKATQWLKEFLEAQGLVGVEMPCAGLETAFRVQHAFNGWSSPADGPTIAVLCEYDALPEIGHACGHNIIAASGAGAAVAAFLVAKEFSGSSSAKWRLQCIGTPAEEGGAGKEIMIEAGIFKEVDFVFMTHPTHVGSSFVRMMGVESYKFEFTGKAAHAAAEPWNGLNALDAVVNMYQSVALMRQQVRPDARINGMITKAGEAANIIPAFTSAHYMVRSDDDAYLSELLKRIQNIATASALACGCQVTWRPLMKGYRPLKYAPSLCALFQKHMERISGESYAPQFGPGMASTDCGNVSQVVPTVHACTKLETEGEKKFGPHTKEFAVATCSKDGIRVMLHSARAVAVSVLELAHDSELQKTVKAEFVDNKKYF